MTPVFTKHSNNIILHIMNLPSQSRDHTERSVPKNPESIFLIYPRENNLCANFPGSQIVLSRDCRESIHKTFQDYKYLLLRSL